MISIIVIGKNEGWKLTKCLESIIKLIKTNDQFSFEIIYVDSNSIDQSIEIARQYFVNKIIKLNHEANAAYARNLGASKANGDILFFVDGDMEVNHDFLASAIIGNKLKYDSLTGHLLDVLYDSDWNFIECVPRTFKGSLPKNEISIYSGGGIFLVKKSVWNNVIGMKNNLDRNEDIDFFLRLAGKGYKIVRLPVLVAKHHTINYLSENRMWVMVKEGYFLYPPIIFRKHFFSFNVWKKTVRSNYSSYFLLVPLITFFLVPYSIISLLLFLFYLLIIVVRIIKTMNLTKLKSTKLGYFFSRLFIQFISDIFFWFSFFLYYPKEKTAEYEILNRN